MGTISVPRIHAVQSGSVRLILWVMGISPRPNDCSRAWQGTHVPIKLSEGHRSRKRARYPEYTVKASEGRYGASERIFGAAVLA